MTKALVDELFNSYISSTTTSASDERSNLTFDKLLQAKREELKKPVLYYAMSKFLPKGKTFLLPEGDFHPEYFVCHPDDFENVSSEIAISHTLVPLADYHPTQEQSTKALEKRMNEFCLWLEESVDPRVIARRRRLAEMAELLDV